jgi:hypothetical protein
VIGESEDGLAVVGETEDWLAVVGQADKGILLEIIVGASEGTKIIINCHDKKNKITLNKKKTAYPGSEIW